MRHLFLAVLATFAMLYASPAEAHPRVGVGISVRVAVPSVYLALGPHGAYVVAEPIVHAYGAHYHGCGHAGYVHYAGCQCGTVIVSTPRVHHYYHHQPYLVHHTPSHVVHRRHSPVEVHRTDHHPRTVYWGHRGPIHTTSRSHHYTTRTTTRTTRRHVHSSSCGHNVTITRRTTTRYHH